MVESGQIKDNTVLDVHTFTVSHASGKGGILVILDTTVSHQNAPPMDKNALAIYPINKGGAGAGGPPPPQAAYQAAAAAGIGGGGLPPPPQMNQNTSNNPYGAPPAQYVGNDTGYPQQPPPQHVPPPPPQQNYGSAYGPPQSSRYGAPTAPSVPGGGAGNYRAIGATARNESPAHINPIASLNSYQNRWTIKARAAQKSEIRRYSNAKGEGKFFSFDVVDNQGGEIRVVGWNDQCDRFYDQVQVGSVYMLSKGSLRNKRGNYNQTRHQFEIHLESGSILERCDDAADIPKMLFQFMPIAQLSESPQGTVIDVVGVIEKVEDWTTLQKKDGNETKKRVIVLRDNSGASIDCTLWGNYANDPGDKLYQEVSMNNKRPVIAIKAARVGDYNGKTISTTSATALVIDPLDVAEAAMLRSWYDNEGIHAQAHALSNVRGAGGAGGGRSDRLITLAQIEEEGMGGGGQAANLYDMGGGGNNKGDWVQVVGSISYIKSDSISYPACTNIIDHVKKNQCAKKLTDQNAGNHAGEAPSWYCERCGMAPASGAEWRYILHTNIADHTGECWATAFNEVGQVLLDHPAEQLKQVEAAQGEEGVRNILNGATFRMYEFKLRVQQEVYQEEARRRVTIIRAVPLDSDPAALSTQTKNVIAAIERARRGEPVVLPPGAAATAGGAQEQQQQQQQQQFGAPAAMQTTPGYQQQGNGGAYGGQQQQQQQGGGWQGGAPQQQGAGPYGGGGAWNANNGGGYQAPPPAAPAPGNNFLYGAGF